MSRSLALPWWLAFWRRLCGLFRQRAPAKESAALPPRRIDPRPIPPPARGLRPLRQVPASKEDIKRLGKQAAVSIALGDNAKRVERATIRARDGELYVVWHGGTMVKTNGQAAARPDGTLLPLPPDPRPTKRERAKTKRALKRRKEQ
jgi:hypothetical protein